MSAKTSPTCQVPYLEHTTMKFAQAKVNNCIRFTNENGEEIGILEFTPNGLSFEGIADEAAIIFLGCIGETYKKRLKEQYDKGYKDGKTSQQIE